jgi:hypothetical protein
VLWQQGINWQEHHTRFQRGGYVQRRVIARTFTVEDLAQVSPLHEARTHPDRLIRRQVIVPLELPPWLQVANG